MANMNPKKVKMPHLEPHIRNKNFEEVALGYSIEEALEEAERCLQCKHRPCVSGCPVNVNIPDFIQQIKNKNFEEAYNIIKETNGLPAVCGRVCPQESQCEAKCVRGIKGEAVAIGRLERFVSDYYRNNCKTKIDNIESNNHKVAVIGSGPSGLTCASDLAKKRYEVTIFEALHEPGGVLVYGIPEFRLPKSIVKNEIESLKELGVKIELNMVIGKILTIDDLFDQGFEAVFIGSGAGLPNFMNIEGETLNGVFSANEYLTRINLMKAYQNNSDTPIYKAKRAAIVGGGNVAMDAARCAKRLGVEEVYIVYRRGLEELPARKEEVDHAIEEGIIFKTLCDPIRIISDETGNVAKIECVQMRLGEEDQSGRRRPIRIEDSNFEIDVDCVIMAIGTSPNPLIHNTTEGLDTNNRGCLVVDENYMTTHKAVYAGGDAVTGSATVILAMGAGKAAAESIDDFITAK